MNRWSLILRFFRAPILEHVILKSIIGYLSLYIRLSKIILRTETRNIPRSLSKSCLDPLFLKIVLIFANCKAWGMHWCSLIELKSESNAIFMSFPMTSSLKISFKRPWGSRALLFFRSLSTTSMSFQSKLVFFLFL